LLLIPLNVVSGHGQIELIPKKVESEQKEYSLGLVTVEEKSSVMSRIAKELPIVLRNGVVYIVMFNEGAEKGNMMKNFIGPVSVPGS